MDLRQATGIEPSLYLLYAESTTTRPLPLPSQTVFPTTAALKRSVLRSWNQISLGAVAGAADHEATVDLVRAKDILDLDPDLENWHWI